MVFPLPCHKKKERKKEKEKKKEGKQLSNALARMIAANMWGTFDSFALIRCNYPRGCFVLSSKDWLRLWSAISPGGELLLYTAAAAAKCGGCRCGGSHAPEFCTGPTPSLASLPSVLPRLLLLLHPIIVGLMSDGLDNATRFCKLATCPCSLTRLVSQEHWCTTFQVSFAILHRRARATAVPNRLGSYFL